MQAANRTDTSAAVEIPQRRRKSFGYTLLLFLGRSLGKATLNRACIFLFALRSCWGHLYTQYATGSNFLSAGSASNPESIQNKRIRGQGCESFTHDVDSSSVAVWQWLMLVCKFCSVVCGN